MRPLALLLLLLQPEESLRERVLRLAKDPAANREQIAALGTSAIRPLLEIRGPAIEPLLLDLKFAGPGGREARDRMREAAASFTVSDLAVDRAVHLAGSLSGLPVLVDPGLREELAGRTVSLDLQNESMKGILDLVCAEAGLDYGWIRGMLVLSRPDRLWPHPPGRRRRLDEGEVAGLKAQIGRLSDDSIEVRADAALAIEALGEAALPWIEDASGRGDAEARARLRSLLESLRTRQRPACFARIPAIERQELSPTGREVVRTLRERKTEPIDAGSLPLRAALDLVAGPTGLEVEWAVPAGARKADCVFGEIPLADAIFFLTIPYGLDVRVREGRLVVDTIENTDRVLEGR